MNHAAQYALRAAVYLARRDAEPRISVQHIAAALALPRNYLSKILHTLAHTGVLVSTRGPRGGFHLGRAPGDITLAQVLEPFSQSGTSTCLLSGEPCTPESACTAHGKWHAVSQDLSTFFQETTLEMLAQTHSSPTQNGGIYGEPRRS